MQIDEFISRDSSKNGKKGHSLKKRMPIIPGFVAKQKPPKKK